MELFSGFLIVIELTVIFIFLTFFFFFYIENNLLRINLFYNFFFFYFYLFTLVIININFFFFFFNNKINSNYFILENYFEAGNNFNMNDFISLFLNYYNFNSINFLIICLLLLLGSVICVNLNQINYFFKNIEIFHKRKQIKQLKNFFFFRKQNLVYQSNAKPTIRIVKKV